MLGYANHVGLYPEELGPSGEHLAISLRLLPTWRSSARHSTKFPLQEKRSTHDLRWSKTMLHLSESDLRFLVETVAPNRRDYDHVTNLIRDKEDLLEPM